ncbi:MAG: prepilin-type N-terminal cleavage/methylation domain-containing protein [Lachnospiraceae bacterium]|nr:prepilin-type N-terminal cleavage/methylation domain-containing protein [Lachnospiraceae bacterium]
MTKKTNNKGFSLVELIIVIAIMAVLMVVLAPQLLRYVENSRLQRDNSAISEIANAVEIACANEDVAEELTGTVTITAAPVGGTDNNQRFTLTGITDGAGNTLTALSREVSATVGNTVDTSSRTYRNASGSDPLQIVITPGANGTVVITANNWADEVDSPTIDNRPF